MNSNEKIASEGSNSIFINKKFLFGNVEGFLAVVGTFVIVFDKFVNVIYSLKCERYYSIPREYFAVDTSYSFAGAVFLIVLICYMIFAYKNPLVGNEGNDGSWIGGLKSFYLLFLGLVYACFNTNNFLMLVMKYNVFSEDSIILVGVITFLIFVLGIIMFLGKGILATIGVVAYFVILVCTIWSCFDYSICDKRNYEFAKIDGIEYVVLSKKEGSLVLVEVQGEDNELGSHYVFCVDKYLLFNKNEVVLEWQNLYNEPEIKKAISKHE